jgi:hypothetical protein
MRRTLSPHCFALLALAGLVGCAEAAGEPKTEASEPKPSAEPQAPASAKPAAAKPAAAKPVATKPAEESWPVIEPVKPITDDHIYSKVRHLWIRPAKHSKAWSGYLSLGDAIRVKGGDAEAAFAGPGNGERCAKWYAVEPQGFVCTGTDATLDAKDPAIVELRKHRADPSSPWPYHYGESIGTPVYDAVPSPDKQRGREYQLTAHLDKVARASATDDEQERIAINKHFRGMDFAKAGKGPPELLALPPGGRVLVDKVVRGSTIAYTRSFDHEGRTFLLTWDRGVVPKDKVRPFPESTFHGVKLGKRWQLPIAFPRGKDAPKYRRKSDGSFEPSGAHWKRLSKVALTGERQQFADENYYLTKEDGLWLKGHDVSIARRAKELPARMRNIKEGRRSWLDISILGGTLVAYEFDKPVYATLVSPGRGGVPHRGIPTLDTASTPVGAYSVLGKFLTATMVSGSSTDLVHAEVQYTQNITGPYALHGAYWHDRWGEKKSGGCVNLSPIDSRRVFAWTDPRLPPGWHGMRSQGMGDMTVVNLRR